jgi:flagellar hook-associated protein 3 FlgL
MRVSSYGSYQRGLALMQSLQAMLDRTQKQIATGKRILTPSDDPIASSRTLDMRESLSRIDQFERNINIATINLQEEEAALKGVDDVLQRVRELALQANNSTQSGETRDLIAIEMREHLDHLVQLANQQDGQGNYIFSGNLESTIAVTRSGGTFTYNGDQGQREVQIGEQRRVAVGDSGDDIFFRIRAGNAVFVAEASGTNTGTGVVTTNSVTNPTLYDGSQYTVRFVDPANYEILDSGGAVIGSGGYTSGAAIAFQGVEFSLEGQPAAGDEFVVSPSPNRSMFESIESIIEAIEQPVDSDASRAALTNRINRGLENLDQSIGSVLDVRTRVGSRLAAIENQTDTNDSLALNLQQTIGELEDLDYAEALSRLSYQLTVLEAAQQSFVKTQSLSLFNYL